MLGQLLRYSTGPVSSSRGLNNIHFVLLNPSTRSARARVKIFDLTKMKTVFEQDYDLAAQAIVADEKLTGVAYWEAQFTTANKVLMFWVAGRDSVINLPGNTFPHASLVPR